MAEELVNAGSDLRERLVEWRCAAAESSNLTPGVVLPYSALREITAVRPATLDELATVAGIGPRRLSRWGDAILGAVAAAQPYRVPARLAELVDAGYTPDVAQAIDVRIAAAARHHAPRHFAYVAGRRVPAWAMRAAAAAGRRIYAEPAQTFSSRSRRAEEMWNAVDDALGLAVDVGRRDWLLKRPDAADVCGWLAAEARIACYLVDPPPSPDSEAQSLAWWFMPSTAAMVCLPPLRAGFTGREVRLGWAARLVMALAQCAVTLPDEIPDDQAVDQVDARMATAMRLALADAPGPLGTALTIAAVRLETANLYDAQHHYDVDPVTGQEVFRCRPECQRQRCASTPPPARDFLARTAPPTRLAPWRRRRAVTGRGTAGRGAE